ncbi:UNVERIFIED_CONTAM: Egg cell-secreted protein 1.1 [Sesamum angustifolium]|uniref:Egg cell-secreted protein 1.1 n=1 Tax=Sesamum angustifolium TaxID=2727405 RepID=A0AAW2KWL3_9LAMI
MAGFAKDLETSDNHLGGIIPAFFHASSSNPLFRLAVSITILQAEGAGRQYTTAQILQVSDNLTSHNLGSNSNQTHALLKITCNSSALSSSNRHKFISLLRPFSSYKFHPTSLPPHTPITARKSNHGLPYEPPRTPARVFLSIIRDDNLSTEARLDTDPFSAAETRRRGPSSCWDALFELHSCSGEVLLFFLNGETHLGPGCCSAIRIIEHQCWPSMLGSLGITTEESDILRGYCDAAAAAAAPPPAALHQCYNLPRLVP